jgi:hypothetical protein
VADPAGRHHSDSNQRKEDNPVPQIELNLAPTGYDMQEMARDDIVTGWHNDIGGARA